MRYNLDPNKALIYTHPEIAKEWHPTLNVNLTPYDVTAGSGLIVYWQCKEGHVWRCRIQSRLQSKKAKSECPQCKTLANKYPYIAKEWCFERNGQLAPNDVAEKSAKIVYWKCRNNPAHIWQCKISSRTFSKSGCPYCTHHKFDKSSSLGSLNPVLAKELHKKMNKNIDSFNIPSYSRKKVYWQCSKNKNHVWEASPFDRHRRKSGCPYCARISIHPSETLASVAPNLVTEWHPTENGKRTPYNVSATSTYIAKWICQNDPKHVWKEKVYLRTAMKECPYC